jgi:hypothetical protein
MSLRGTARRCVRGGPNKVLAMLHAMRWVGAEDCAERVRALCGLHVVPRASSGVTEEFVKAKQPCMCLAAFVVADKVGPVCAFVVR